MRVLILNTSERTGGAAVAASRLHAALTHIGVEAEMLVRDRQTASPQVHTFPNRWRMKWAFLRERFGHFLPFARPEKATFRFGYGRDRREGDGNSGLSPSRRHSLHWINQGLLSLDELERILRDGKTVVWTMHDIWPVTGICTWHCPARTTANPAEHAPIFPTEVRRAISLIVYGRRNSGSIRPAPCFRGVQSLVGRRSAQRLAHSWANGGQYSQPNRHRRLRSARSYRRSCATRTSHRFFPAHCPLCRPAHHESQQGHALLVEAFRQYLSRYPEHHHNTALFILGGEAEEFRSAFDVPVFTTPYTYDVETIVRIYNAANLFVLPSISENLPNTIMEALACGIPCLGFRIGGIPEMIDHERNGYVAAAKDAEDLSAGLHYLLDWPSRPTLASRS